MNKSIVLIFIAAVVLVSGCTQTTDPTNILANSIVNFEKSNFVINYDLESIQIVQSLLGQRELSFSGDLKIWKKGSDIRMDMDLTSSIPIPSGNNNLQMSMYTVSKKIYICSDFSKFYGASPQGLTVPICFDMGELVGMYGNAPELAMFSDFDIKKISLKLLDEIKSGNTTAKYLGSKKAIDRNCQRLRLLRTIETNGQKIDTDIERCVDDLLGVDLSQKSIITSQMLTITTTQTAISIEGAPADSDMKLPYKVVSLTDLMPNNLITSGDKF